MKRIIYILVTALLFAAGCSKKEKKFIPFSPTAGDTASTKQAAVGTNVTGATLSKISVSPASLSIAKDTNATYTATAIYSDGTIKDISSECNWTVKSETDKVSVAGSKKGRFLGSATTVSGTPAKVNASYDTFSGDANLIITGATLSSVQITSVPSLVTGGTATYTATGVFSDGTTQDISPLVTWSSNNATSIAIDANTGLATGGNNSGTATVSATLTSPATFPAVTNNGIATTNTVLTNVSVVSVTVTGALSLAAGNTSNYLASAIYSNGSSSDITSQATWTLSNSSNASINDSAGSKGVLTSISVGSTTVQATYIGVVGNKAVTISAATVSSVTVSPSSISIAKGTSTQLTAMATYSDGSIVNVTNSAVWSSSSAAVAGVTTSSSTGGATQGIDVGASTISATIGGVSGSSNISVGAATLVSIAINSSATIDKGTNKQFTAIGTYTDGTTQNITSLVSWSSSSTSNVTISNGVGTKGLATGAGQGSSTIQASLGGINSNSSTLSISAASLSSIAIGSDSSVENGLSKQYTATGTFSDGTTQNITSLVTWNSATAANATISNAIADKGKAYALALGTTNITASLPNGTNGIATTGGATIASNTSVLTVSAAATTLVAVTGVNLEVGSGTTTETKPNGAFDGALLIIGDENTKGFVANITGGTLNTCADVTCLMNKILQAISEDDSDFNGTNNTNSILESAGNGGYNIVTRKTVSGVAIPTEIASVEIKVNNTKTLPETSGSSPYSVNDMRNHYVNLVGKVDGSGTITDLPGTGSGAATSTTFRIEVQASKNSSSTLVMLGITSTTNFNTVEIPLTSLVNGTNMAPSSYGKTAGTKNFASSGPPKVDFLISVNNSATMSGEQTGLRTSLASFFARLKSLGTDFRMSVVTSDCDKLWRPDTVLRSPLTGQNQTCQPTGVGSGKGINDWGTGVSYFDDTKETEFNTTIGKIGIRGWSVESNLLYAEKAIASTGTFTQVRAANGRSSVPMTVIVISDDPDQYDAVRTALTSPAIPSIPPPATTWSNNSNEFVSQSVTVHTVSPLNASGIPATCIGPNGDTGEMDDFNATPDIYQIYKNISTKTGGMASTICAANPSSFMELIADQAAAGASTYSLDHVPITNTLQVKVNGASIEMGIASAGTTKYIYNSATNKISFTGTIPAVNTPIVVSYSYYTTNVAMTGLTENSKLMAYISKTASSDSARGGAAAIALLVGAILAGRIWNRKNK